MYALDHLLAEVDSQQHSVFLLVVLIGWRSGLCLYGIVG